MSTNVVLAVAALALSLTAGQAVAESEGNGDPFPFQAGLQVTNGHAFAADTGSAGYPQLTGNNAQPSSLERLEPAFGHEALIQTANSLPKGSSNGTVAYVQAQGLRHYSDTKIKPMGFLEAGSAWPKGN